MQITSTEPTREGPQFLAGGRESIFHSWQLLLFAALGGASIAIWFAPLASSFALALRDDQYTHILLILPLSAALLLLNRKEVSWKGSEGESSRPGLRIGSALLAIAALVTGLARWQVLPLSSDEQLAAKMVAFVVWWLAAFIICFGIRTFRDALFPLCFLFWIVPLPQVVLDQIVGLLQRGSAAAAHLLFLVAGFPVAQRGTLVHIPGLTLEVAPECSSIRSSMMLLVTTMVLAHLLLRSPWRKIVVVAAAIPLSIAKNGFRIFVLGALATRVNPSFLTGRLHREGGIIFFLIALAGIFLLIWILHRGELKNTRIVPSGSV
jgi:exosortase